MILYSRKWLRQFQIDESDFSVAIKHDWFIDEYPKTNVRSATGKKRTLTLHQLLLGRAPNGMVWDHINRDKMDNRRGNFRLVPHAVNLHNTKLPSNNTSGLKGVYWSKEKQRWKAAVKAFGTVHNIGYFDSKEAAGVAVADKRKQLGVFI